jgi:homoserine kinase
VTLSGSGPSVVVWTEPGRVQAVAAALAARLDDARVLPLAIAGRGTESR